MPRSWARALPLRLALRVASPADLPLGRLVVLACALAGLAAEALAQAPPRVVGGIYTCIDDRGRRLTADRPIAECSGKEQQVLNRDGSLRTVIPPTLTAEERAEKEARERAEKEARAAAADAVRRDRNLVARFPNEAAHLRAREAALDTVRLAMKATEIRLRDLAAQRKPLKDEAEFYEGRQLPPKLRAQIDANEAAVEAQRAAAATQQAEVARINGLYDAELDRLRKLWGGAPAGSLGPMPATAAPATARPASQPGRPAPH
jgi:hypothetical protein